MNIAVILGGESCEHDISIITGLQLIANINEYLYNVFPIFIDKNGKWLTGDCLNNPDEFMNNIKNATECCFVPNSNILYVKKGKKYKKFVEIDMVFVCLHGANGEDGSVASVLNLSKIPYSSSYILASSVCLDKCVFKTYAQGLGINVVDGVEVIESDYIMDKENVLEKLENIGYPMIIKPSRQGSSIGIEVCENKSQIHNCLKNAFKYDKKILIEKYIDVFKEVNIALVCDKGQYIFSNTEEPITDDKFLSFDNKYKNNSGGFESIKRISPAEISEDQDVLIKEISLKLYKSLEMFGVVRFDFLISKDGEVYINEVNTIPGSMANYLFDKNKYDYSKLIEMLISNSVFRLQSKYDVINVFDSGVNVNSVDMLKK